MSQPISPQSGYLIDTAGLTNIEMHCRWGSGVNDINTSTCTQLGITDWEVCPFWLRMADTHYVWLIRKLGIVVGGHQFDVSAVVLALDAPGAYPILLGRPWLRSAHIKQNWEHNCISFKHGCDKVCVPTPETMAPTKGITPLHAEDINMLEDWMI